MKFSKANMPHDITSSFLIFVKRIKKSRKKHHKKIFITGVVEIILEEACFQSTDVNFGNWCINLDWKSNKMSRLWSLPVLQYYHLLPPIGQSNITIYRSSLAEQKRCNDPKNFQKIKVLWIRDSVVLILFSSFFRNFPHFSFSCIWNIILPQYCLKKTRNFISSHYYFQTVSIDSATLKLNT